MTTKGWAIVIDRDVHVIPIDDEIPHVHDDTCPCRPSRDEQQPGIVIHHAADGREHFEPLAVQ